MSYTRKQKIYAEYMLHQFGISDSVFINQYLFHLELLYGKMEQYVTRWKYSVSSCVEMLKEEQGLRKNIYQIKIKESFNKKLYATDYANYSYCPVSYVISKSFEIEKPSGVEYRDIGSNLHEKLLLLNKINSNSKLNEDDFFENLRYETGLHSPLIKKISNSTLIFAGHIDSKIFINNEENYAGSPDYIFQDEQGDHFIVEEKFHYKKDPFKEGQDEYYYRRGINVDEYREKWQKHKVHFFDNHKVQLISYIRNIKEFDIKYGYLIYWYYDFSTDAIPYVHRDAVLEMKLDSQSQKLYDETKTNIERVLQNKVIEFDVTTLNPKKCAGCVVNKYCGHKSSKYKKINLPYNPNDLTLIYVPFPEELRNPPTTNI